MNIAMMALGYVPAPRPSDMVYAPIDIAVVVAEGIARRGHRVDFFAPLGSHFHDSRVSVRNLNIRPLAHNQQEMTNLFRSSDRYANGIPALWDQRFAGEMFTRAQQGVYDVIHFHHPEAALPFAKLYGSIPALYTLHDPVTRIHRELFELYQTPNQHYVSISLNQRRDAPDLNYIANIYNGINTHSFSFSDDPEDYLLYVGRIVPDKGVKEAVHVARETGSRLLIIGQIYPDSQEYFDQYIKPYLGGKILYLGHVERTHLPKYYQKAKALLTPVQWEEPFGLTTIEAMACGTPVISLRRGAAPEIIKNGKSGYVVDSISEMIKAVRKIDQVNRQDCRTHVQTHFSTETMIDGYEATYRQILTHTSPVRRLRRRVSSKLQLGLNLTTKTVRSKQISKPVRSKRSRQP
jgi:glycosyltransferase involved in cell wall biosynthesis